MDNMTTVTLDRFGRIVIPHELRQRHGWRPGTTLELRDGPDGFVATPVQRHDEAPAGWTWSDGLLVCTSTPTGDLTDIAAVRDAVDAARDRELSGLP
jgi:AbrB family looped-hinge helix DNA binding protein